MTTQPGLIAAVLFLGHACALGQQTDSTAQRTINLHQAVELALKHNHVVRIAGFKVEENQHAKEVARSAYSPVVKNDSVFLHVTDTSLLRFLPGGSVLLERNPFLPGHFFSIKADT